MPCQLRTLVSVATTIRAGPAGPLQQLSAKEAAMSTLQPESITRVRAASATPRSSLRQTFTEAWTRFRQANLIWRVESALNALDDTLLRDIGVSRDRIADFARKGR
jgi:uncharacterized protein YjiS (DUF1127 family)